MWVQHSANRHIFERELIKDHLLHQQRLRNVRPCIDMKRPPRPAHIGYNPKGEMRKRERQSEIQY